MRILALETSGLAGEVALLEGHQVVATRLLDPQQRTARSLAPGMAAVLSEAGWRPQDVELVAVTIGPGSFTGLRFGVTTTKTFAYAVKCQALGVDTLEVVAAQIPQESGVSGKLWIVLDAQRSQLFAARFERQEASWRLTEPTAIIDNDGFLEALMPGDMVAGSGLKRIAADLPHGVTVAPENLWQPHAAMVGQLAWRDFQAGRRDDFWKLSPVYLRPSAAEEKRSSPK